MKLPRNTPLNLLQNRILIMLNGGGPRTASELAVLLNNKRSSVLGANAINVQRGLVDVLEDKRFDERVYSITADGITAIGKLPQIREKPKAIPNARPVKDLLIEAMKSKEGLKSSDWRKYTTSRNQVYGHIYELQSRGYVISKSKKGVIVTYRLASSPS